MKAFNKFLIVLLLLIIPVTVNAGIICSDGWESSCIVPGPGCCSHHGGIGGGGNYNNYSSTDDGFIERLNDGEYAGILTVIILGVPIILGLYFESKELKEKQKVIVEDTLDNQDDVDEIEEDEENEDQQEEIHNENILEDTKEVIVDNLVEEDSKYNSKVTWFIILIILSIIALSIYLSKDEKMTVEKFARYITDDVVEKYIENKGEVIDEKVYINDFYQNVDYQDSYYYDTFKEYYEELEEEVKDDYILIINFDEENYRVFYYDKEDKYEEFVDYIKYFASQYYVENILEQDWSYKQVKISVLKNEGYIRNSYFKNLYNELQNQVKDDEVVIYSNITWEDIYEIEYIENR